MSDFYRLLGLPRDCAEADIKKAYRKLAMEYHPDRNSSPDAEARFKEITEAYEVLRDPQKRAAYDRYGKAGVGAGAGGVRNPCRTSAFPPGARVPSGKVRRVPSAVASTPSRRARARPSEAGSMPTRARSSSEGERSSLAIRSVPMLPDPITTQVSTVSSSPR